MTLTLRTRLALWFAASLLLILTPILASILLLQWRSMRVALDHHLEEDLETALELLVIRETGVQWRTDTATDLGYDAGPERWVEVHGAAGEVLFLRGLPKQAGIRAALKSPTGESGYRTIRTPAGAYVRTLTAERAVHGTRAWIRVARTEDSLRADLRRLAWVFALGAPLAIVVAALAGYWVSGRALRPLVRMTDRARSISADRLSERLPVVNPADEMGQLAVVFNDTFRRLEESFERLKRFTADASHELRTPLTAIRSVGEVGLREARDHTAYQEIIGSMLEEADRLANVVDTLLTLSRREGAGARVSTEAVDLRTLAEDVVAQLSALAEERGIAVEIRLAGPLVVAADAIMTRQAITNVLDNAIKFTPDGGAISVWSRTTPQEHHLVVDDQGPGIPPDQRHLVLERFYRVDGAGYRGAAGAGLGLAIVQQAMTANGGRVVIDGNEAGGARVVLALPRTDAPVRPSRRAEQTRTSS